MNDLNRELAKGLSFNNLEALSECTKDQEKTSKLLIAHYRRITTLEKFVEAGKAKFPE